MGVTIKEAQLVEELKGSDKLPVSDGSNIPKSVSVEQIKIFANKGVEIPTKVSELENDSEFTTKKELEKAISSIPIPDVSGQISEALADYVKKVEGKGLSTNDFTNELKDKLEGITPYDPSELEAEIGKLETALNTLVGSNASNAIESFNEIIAFLDGISDSEDLDSIVASIERQVASKYSKPSSGIPKADLSSDVQSSLNKAESALQKEQFKGTISAVDTDESVDDPNIPSGSYDDTEIKKQIADLETKVSKKADEAETASKLSELGSELQFTDVYYFTDKNIIDGVLVEKTGEGYIPAVGSSLIGASYADYYEIEYEANKKVFVKAFLSGGTRNYINLAVKYKGNIVSKKNISYEGEDVEIVLLVPRDSTLCISVQKNSEVRKGYKLEDKYKEPLEKVSNVFKVFNSLNGCIVDDSKFDIPDNITSVSGAISGNNPHISNTTTKYGKTNTCVIDGKSRTKLVKVRSDYFGTNAKAYSSLAIFKPNGECLYNNNVRGVTYILVYDELVIRTLWGGSNPILVKNNESNDGFDIEEKFKELESSINNVKVKKLNGTNFVTIGDSLSETGKWQSKFEELSGCHYYSDKDLGVRINKGGTVTGPVFTDCGMTRIKNLASIKDRFSLDFIIYENVNDHGAFAMGGNGIEGGIDDNPWMQGSKVDYRTSVFDSRSELDSFLSSNFQSILSNTSSIDRKKGGYFVFAYFSNGGKSSFRFSVKQSATADGDLKLYRSGNLHLTIPISTSMTLEDIAMLIYNSDFGAGCINIIEPNNSVVVRMGGSTAQYTIDANTTGAIVEVEEVKEPILVPKLFTGLLSDDWMDDSKWVESVSLYSLYKGLVEFAKTEFPLTKFYWMIPNLYSVSKNASYVNSDGTFNVSAYKKTALSIGWERLRKVVMDVCELYNVPVLDVDKNSNISLENVLSFFKENDVHPLDEGYYRWGETMNSLI